MRKVGLLLLSILLLISCAKEEFVINTANVKQSCIDNINSATFTFDLSLEDDYSLQVEDEYNLIWGSSLKSVNNRYQSEELTIPYQINGTKLTYKLIASSGKYLEGAVQLNDTNPAIWSVVENKLIPSKEIDTQITLIKEDSSTVLTSDKEIELEEGVKSIIVEYDYLNIHYKYTITL